MACGCMWLATLLVLLLPVDACVNDDSTADEYNDTCASGYYDFYPSECAYYDDDDFSAYFQCCGCYGFLLDLNESKGCINNDTTTDTDGYSCTASGGWYWGYPTTCGYYDDDDYTAGEQCCACGGGHAPEDVTFCGYGEEECSRAAIALGLALGAPWENESFAAKDKSEDGCYMWRHGYWAGSAWYGLLDDGSEPQSDAQLPEVQMPKVRLPGTHSCGAPLPPAPASAPRPAEGAPTLSPTPAAGALDAGGTEAANKASAHKVPAPPPTPGGKSITGGEAPVPAEVPAPAPVPGGKSIPGGLASDAQPVQPPFAAAVVGALLLMAGS